MGLKTQTEVIVEELRRFAESGGGACMKFGHDQSLKTTDAPILLRFISVQKEGVLICFRGGCWLKKAVVRAGGKQRPPG